MSILFFPFYVYANMIIPTHKTFYQSLTISLPTK